MNDLREFHLTLTYEQHRALFEAIEYAINDSRFGDCEGNQPFTVDETASLQSVLDTMEIQHRFLGRI